MILWLLEAGADREAVNKDGETTLILAARNGKAKAVKMLLKVGANADAKDQSDNSAMSWAEREGHDEIVKMLREHSAG